MMTQSGKGEGIPLSAQNMRDTRKDTDPNEACEGVPCIHCAYADREHIIQVQLPASYPEGAPLVTADLPQGAVSLDWQAGASGLRRVWDAYATAIQQLQDLFLCLDDLDRSSSLLLV